MRYEMRPLGPWTDPLTADRVSSRRFRAAWTDTLKLLGHETELLGATLVVLQVDVREGEIRRDGMLRADAKVGFPGVRVSFDSRHGPLTYATDAYEAIWALDPPGWQANVRAIALALEALRAVDRYGVSRRGQQYTGWRALPAGAAPDFATAEQAARFLQEQAGPGAPFHTRQEIVTDELVRRGLYRLAAKRLHPDAGGDPDLWHRLDQARQLLDAAAGNR